MAEASASSSTDTAQAGLLGVLISNLTWLALSMNSVSSVSGVAR
jgi:hypothetical protein